MAFSSGTLSGLFWAALLLLSIAVVLGAIGATGLAFDGLIGALSAEAEFLAPLALFGSAYAFEFLFLVWGELWAIGLVGFVGADFFFGGGVDLLLSRFGCGGSPRL